MKINLDGIVPVTTVDGNSFVGLRSADGSTNVFDATSETTNVGVYHPSGALNITIVDGSEPVGVYADNGSLNVVNDSGSGKRYHPSGAMNVTGASSAVFNPATLFTSGEVGSYYDISDLSTLFQERTGASATTPAVVDGVVGTVLDKSGNDDHMIALSNGVRPILRQDGSMYYLDFDGIDDELQHSTTNSATSTFVIGMESSDTAYMLATNAARSRWIYVAQQGSAATSVYELVGSPTTRIDGVATSPATRNDAYVDANDGDPHVITTESLNLTSVAEFQLFGYGGSFAYDGKYFGHLLIDRALTTDERSDIEAYYSALNGA